MLYLGSDGGDDDNDDDESYADSDAGFSDEEEGDDERGETLVLNEETLEMLRRDGIASLYVNGFGDIDEEDAGRLIGRSANLKRLAMRGELNLDHDGCSSQDRFLAHVGLNRSMEELVLVRCPLLLSGSASGAFASLMSFVRENDNLRSVRIKSCGLGDAGARDIASALSRRSDKEPLRRLELVGNGIRDEPARDLVEVLRGYANLEDLNLNRNQIGGRACLSLGSMLSDANCKLSRLDLEDNSLDDDCVEYLADSLKGNKTLAILNLSANRHVTPSGWARCFTCLRSPDSALEALDVSMNNISDEGIRALGDCMVHNKSLKALELNQDTRVIEDVPDITRITPNGWQSFFVSMQNSSSVLCELFFANADLGEGGLAALSNLMRDNSTIKILALGNCHCASSGWRSFFTCLQSPNTSLKELHLEDNNLTDELIADLAPALRNNVTLQTLNLEGNPDITCRGWGHFVPLLCDIGSPSGIYASNHTLYSLGKEGTQNRDVHPCIPEHLLILLYMNHRPNKADVRREKILQVHFRANQAGKIHVREFVDMKSNMKSNVMPHGMAWIGRDSSWNANRNTGHTLLFHLLRSLPGLLETDRLRSKRKRPR